jgi:hypothetical protein
MIASKKYIFLIILILVITGCTKNKPNIREPDIGVSELEINKRFKLEAPPGWNTFKVGDFIGILVEVTVDDTIYFREDECKIFLFENGSWNEISYIFSEPNEYFLILSNSKGDIALTGSYRLYPEFENIENKAKVRIYVIGHLYVNEQITDNLTAAYLDLELEP